MKVELDLARALGAEEAFRSQKICLYLPDRDKYNNVIPNIRDWVDATAELLVDIAGGCTIMPESGGRWLTQEKVYIKENTTVVYSYVSDLIAFVNNISRIKSLIHEFGRQTGQEVVFVEISGGASDSFVSRAYEIHESKFV